VAGVITCHQLECGHAWHRTIAYVGGIFPGLARNATFAPCDCPDADLREDHGPASPGSREPTPIR
jgi:hypothetical protein